MSRRGRQKAWISLFAFQDIITAVSGILIVTVLLMTLDLMANTQVGDRQSAEIPLDLLQSAISDALERRQALESLLGQSEGIVEQAASIPRDVLSAERHAAAHARNRLDAEIEELQKRLGQSADRRERAEARRFDSQEQAQDLERKRKEIADLHQTLDRHRQQKRVFYQLPRGIQKEGWLVVVGDDTISTAPLSKAARPQTFHRGRLAGVEMGSPVDPFTTWLKKRGDVRGLYVMVLVFPSGMENWDDLEKELTRMHVDYGFDLLGTGQTALDPETGAHD
jgi:hypothetical protein